MIPEPVLIPLIKVSCLQFHNLTFIVVRQMCFRSTYLGRNRLSGPRTRPEVKTSLNVLVTVHVTLVASI